MGVPLTELLPNLTEVDVIIAGGGTAGCVVASRLSDACPSLSVLVIEGGPSNYNDPSVLHPALFLSHMLPTSKKTIFYKAAKESQLADREVVVPSGGLLGGGSSINALTYSRAQRQDFDSWNTPGWTADDMIQYLKKLETYHGAGSASTHGDSGPVHISRGTYGAMRSEDDFIRAAGQAGFPEVDDVMDLDTANAVQRNLRYTSREGVRQDAAHCYLHPRLNDGKHPNLHVLVEHQVRRVLFDNDKKKAIGVELQPNPAQQPDNTSGIQAIKARKMVIISSGALGTPLILERSGVGDPEVLTRAGVGVVANVPGVGRNYLDHQLLMYSYRTSLLPEETADALIGGRLDIPTLMQTNDKILSWNAADVNGKLRPSEEDVASMGPLFRAVWERDYQRIPQKPMVTIIPINGFPGDPTSLPIAQYMSASIWTTYPYSRGHIHITGPKVSDPVDFRTGFFSDTENADISQAVWAYKKQREIFRRMKTYRGEWAPSHPPFPAESAAASTETDSALADVSNIVYTPEDDAVIEKWLRDNVGSTWHSMGTCKMAPREDSGVLDPSLSVYGVEGLKVADLSLVPKSVGANTANTAFAIGEKAADIFIGELRPC